MHRFTLYLLSLIAATAVHAEVIDIDDAELARLQAAGVAVVDVRTGTRMGRDRRAAGKSSADFLRRAWPG